MNDKKHTPGPWIATHIIGSWWIEDDDPTAFCRRRIAIVDDGVGIGSPDANADLIAAAPDMLDELMNYCAECMGDGAERCPYYNKDGDMCRMAQDGTCGTWMTICLATGHNPATPWEVEK